MHIRVTCSVCRHSVFLYKVYIANCWPGMQNTDFCVMFADPCELYVKNAKEKLCVLFHR